MCPSTPPYPESKAVALICFRCLKRDFFVLISVSQTKYPQPSEEFTAGRMGRLSMITQQGHLIPRDPNLGPVT